MSHKVSSSISDEATGVLNRHNPSSLGLKSTQPLTGTSTRSPPVAKGQPPVCKADNLSYMSRLSKKCGSADVSQACYRHSFTIFVCLFMILKGCLCGLVVRIPAYRSRGLSSIPGATRYSEK
jgi:hypothetical protein